MKGNEAPPSETEAHPSGPHKEKRKPGTGTWMMKEIEEQPTVLERILRLETPRVERFSQFLRSRLFHTVILVARGSSDNAALFGRYLIEIATPFPVSLAAPSIHTLYKSRLHLRHTLTIGVSQSGESTDINRVLTNCKRQGSLVIAITNNPESKMAFIADEVFLVHAGRERSVAATKTYTGQLLLFHLLAESIGQYKSFDLQRIPEFAAQVLQLRDRIRSVVVRYRSMDRCVVISRGINYANAFELALKLMETCQVMAKGYSAADFLHGPIAIIEPGFPALLLVPPGKTLSTMLPLQRRLNQLRTKMVVISSNPKSLRQATTPLEMPAEIEEMYSAIPYVIPGQLFAALLADAKGLSPDHPRGLKKITRTI